MRIHLPQVSKPRSGALYQHQQTLPPATASRFFEPAAATGMTSLYNGMLQLDAKVVETVTSSSALPGTSANSNERRELRGHGMVVSVRGSVVDVRFLDYLPAIRTLLRTDGGTFVMEVIAQRDAQHVRCIALTPTEGLARGTPVEDTGAPLMAPVGKGIRSRMFDVFGNVIDGQPSPPDLQWRSVHHAPPPAWFNKGSF